MQLAVRSGAKLKLVCALLMAAALLAPANAQAIGQRAQQGGVVTIQVGVDVREEDAAFVREGIALAQQYATDTFGFPMRADLGVVVRASGGAEVGKSVPGLIAIDTGNASWMEASAALRIQAVIHEYIHSYEWEWIIHPSLVPAWLIEGSTEYLSYHALINAGVLNHAEVNNFHRWNATWADDYFTLFKIEDRADFYSGETVSYSLGYLATDLLLNDGVVDPLVTFLSAVSAGDEWHEAFTDAFDESVAEFYVRFDLARENEIISARVTDAFSPVTPTSLQSAVLIESVSAPIAPGAQMIVLGRANASAICQFSITRNDDPALMAGLTFADAANRLFWIVTVPDNLTPGQAMLTASCGGDPDPIEITISPPGHR